MIHSLSGKILTRGDNFFVVDVGGVGFKVLTNQQTLARLPANGSDVISFCFLYLRENGLELYGFLEEEALKLFEILKTVSGVGPKTALGVLDIDSVPNIIAAIIEKRVELLTKTSGVGKKTAERIVLELQNKVKVGGSKALTDKMGIDMEVEEALVGLGYPRYEVKRALSELEGRLSNLEERLKGALKILSKKK